MVYLRFKAAIILAFETQAQGALAFGIEESRLSRIVRGYRKPSEEELATFRRVLGDEAISGLSAKDPE